MTMIEVTPRVRAQVRTAEQYDQWFNSLRNDQEVLLQRFRSADSERSTYGKPYESWELEKGTLTINKYGVEYCSGGNCCWINALGCVFSDYDDVFTPRLVPIIDTLADLPLGHSVYADRPIYEPAYYESFRHTGLVKQINNLKAEVHQFCFMFSAYKKEVYSGDFLVTFYDKRHNSEIEFPLEIQYLYSEYIAEDA